MVRFFLVLLFSTVGLRAQIVNKTDSNRVKPADTLVVVTGKKDSVAIFRPTIYDYKLRTRFGKEMIFDTLLTANKYYTFTQYNNSDSFGKIRFANIGSGFNKLYFDFNPEKNFEVLPENKSHNIITINSVRYYDVKTPTTTFVYHNAIKSGAALTSVYTQNIGKSFNFAIEYMGLRSQGSYRNSLSANNNTLFSAHFLSNNKRYESFAHFLHQNINSQEFGGISNVDNFLSGDSRFNNKLNLEVNLQSSNSRFSYRRYYFSHEFRPFGTEQFPFKIRHTVFQQTNKYNFGQGRAEAYFYSEANGMFDYPLSSYKYSKNLSNTVSVLFDKENFKLDVGVRHQWIKLGVGEPLLAGQLYIPKEISENRIGAVGNLKMRLLDKVDLSSETEFSRGVRFGNFVSTRNLLRFEPIKGYFVDGHVNFQTAVPDFNRIINTSIYRIYNYFIEHPKNQSVTEIGGTAGINWFDTKFTVNYFRVGNFAYFDSSYIPQQSTNALNITQIGGESTYGFKKIHINGRALFQKTMSNERLYPAPGFIGRLNVYYQTKAFRNAAELQGGIKLNYFSKFASREFSPILNEFVLPGTHAYSVGGKPTADAYLNMKVKRMFFFVEAEHVDATLSRNKAFTAPFYPVSDFRLNLGIVWYLFH